MAKILIVDDDKIRSSRIKKCLIDEFGLQECQIDNSYSINCARSNLKKITYTIAFIDMGLPQFNDHLDVDEWGGIKILKDISNKRLEAPEKIIGYTALKDNLQEKEQKFLNIGFSLSYAKSGDISWLNSKSETINYSLQRSSSSTKFEKDYAILTVHGIRTFGSWQNYLFEQVKEVHSEKNVEHLEFKFTGIDFFTFMIPPLRKKIINRLKSDLASWLSLNRAREIHCFSHSFGTYITVMALEQLKSESGVDSIKSVVLCGSVLDQDYDFSRLNHLKNANIVNDCAVVDIPLLFSEAFVIGTGMAGLAGVRGLSNNRVKNRFFRGGHSMFFNRSRGFIQHYWLPLFNNDVIESNHEIKVNCFQETLIVLARISSKFKLLYPLVLFVISAWSLFKFV